MRLSGPTEQQQVWARVLADGSVAVALYNKGGQPQPPIPGPPCATWTHSTGGYYEACGGAAGDVGTFSSLTPAQAQAACCANPQCAGFSFAAAGAGGAGDGYYKGNAMCGFQKDAGYEGWYKAGQVPSANGSAVDITVNFADVNLFGSVKVRDVWAQADAGVFARSFTAKAVPFHGTAFLRLTQQ